MRWFFLLAVLFPVLSAGCARAPHPDYRVEYYPSNPPVVPVAEATAAPTPVHPQPRQSSDSWSRWDQCVVDGLKARNYLVGAAFPIAQDIAQRCRHLAADTEADIDVQIVVKTIQMLRERQSAAPGFVVGPPQPLPPVDKRM